MSAAVGDWGRMELKSRRNDPFVQTFVRLGCSRGTTSCYYSSAPQTQGETKKYQIVERGRKEGKVVGELSASTAGVGLMIQVVLGTR